MERGIFNYIWRFSGRDQVRLILLSIAALPILYFSFELPKTIVNQAIGGDGGFPKRVLGWEFAQIPYLFLLCGLFLGLVLINLAFKYFTSTYRYRVGDRLLRRLRFDLIERLMRFPPREFRNTSSGQVVSMITAETSPLGFFIAEAFAVPAVAIGTLGTIVLFMFMQNWLMGVAAVSLFPLQLYLIPKIQRRINALQRAEVLEVRAISQRVGDVVAGTHEIHGHDTSQYELADFSQRLGVVFNIRMGIASNRYIVNILNTFFSQLTPFFFLSIGGFLVINGQISLGALVAVLAAYKDMYAPWKDLIDYYQKAEDARVKYDQLRQFFEPAGLLDRVLLTAEPPLASLAGTQLIASNLVLESDDGVKPVDGASVTLTLPIHAAIIVSGGNGGEEFGRALARQLSPKSGRLAFGDFNLSDLPDSVTGRRISYVGPSTHFVAGSLRDALVYGLLHRPADATKQNPDLHEAIHVGNSAYDFSADWIDYDAAGCADNVALTQRMISVLQQVGLEQDIYDIALRRAIDPATHPVFTAKLVAAREILHARLSSKGLLGLIEPFDAGKYLTNASVAENILFGTPVGPHFALDNLGHNTYMQKVIEDVGLTQAFLDKGRKLAAIMVEIFRDLPPGHEFFERFSFIDGEDLPRFEGILRRVDAGGLSALNADDRAHLFSLPFKLIVSQHHVGLIDAPMQAQLLLARHAFARGLPTALRQTVQFFDSTAYNASGSIADNIIFGKIATHRADSAGQVGALVAEALDDVGIRADVVEAGLDFDIGIAGTRLSLQQRQKLALARCLLKRPDILILNESLNALEPAEQDAILTNVKIEMSGRSFFLIDTNYRRAAMMDRVLHLQQGRIVASADVPAIAEEEPNSATHGGDANLEDVVAILRRIPLFTGIDRSKLKLLAFASIHQTFDKGEFVFRQGDSGNNAYVVIDGEVEVVLESVAGPRVVARLARHQLFGEMALLSKSPRATSIRVRSRTQLLVIAHDTFLRLVEENSAIASNIMRTLANRLAATLKDYGKITASHDIMTGLPSQRVFLDSARWAQARRRRYGKEAAIMLFGLDSLSSAVIRTARDELPAALQQATRRIRACLRGADVMAHLYGDQYGIILGEYDGPQDARLVATRITHALQTPFHIQGKPVQVPVRLDFRVAVLDDDNVAATIERCRMDDLSRISLAS